MQNLNRRTCKAKDIYSRLGDGAELLRWLVARVMDEEIQQGYEDVGGTELDSSQPVGGAIRRNKVGMNDSQRQDEGDEGIKVQGKSSMSLNRPNDPAYQYYDWQHKACNLQTSHQCQNHCVVNQKLSELIRFSDEGLNLISGFQGRKPKREIL